MARRALGAGEELGDAVGRGVVEGVRVDALPPEEAADGTAVRAVQPAVARLLCEELELRLSQLHHLPTLLAARLRAAREDRHRAPCPEPPTGGWAQHPAAPSTIVAGRRGGVRIRKVFDWVWW